jgi:putative nucleotidyltransferase with HDIG domain
MIMTPRRSILRRIKLRYVLFVALLLSGIIPFTLSSVVLILRDQEILESKEGETLIAEAGTLSREINDYLMAVRRQLTQLGGGLLLPPGPTVPADRLREPWVAEYLRQFQHDNPDLQALRVLDTEGAGLSRPLDAKTEAAMNAAFEQARREHGPAYRLVASAGGEPFAALAVPVNHGGVGGVGGTQIIVQALLRFRAVEAALGGIGKEVGAFLVDRQGQILWSNGASPALQRALLRSVAVASFVKRPTMSMTHQYTAEVAGKRQKMLAQVSAVPESGWGVIVQKPRAAAFAVVDRMFFSSLLSTLLLVGLAFIFAVLAARLVSQPIQRLAETSHEIAAGNFSRRVEVSGLGSELAELAEDWNRMSLHLESHVQQLRQAAQANRELFIGSLRAFVAAVDAKDPYTRGHSERVAAVSRTIARQLTLPEELQHKVWIGALLHDVGKIGVEDQILKKTGVLTPEEYDQMKLHTVMGADILSRIEQLKEMVPAVRWHHESWNGRGYPDGLKGEQIPLMARIVAVADCFDAITTNRPYQQAYSLQFAVETITKLTGSRFDAKIVTAFLRAFEAGEIRPGASRPVREGTLVEARVASR